MASAYWKVAVTAVVVSRITVQIDPLGEHPLQVTEVEGGVGVPVSVISDPVVNCAEQTAPQLMPCGELGDHSRSSANDHRQRG